jgi:hypothetical protein
VYARFTGTVYYDDLEVKVLNVTDIVDRTADGVPVTFELGDNYPNPFNPSTHIQFGVPNNGNVKLLIYNMMGQRIRTLLDEDRGPGRYDVVWDATDDAGRFVGSGIYFYQLRTPAAIVTKEMLLLK